MATQAEYDAAYAAARAVAQAEIDDVEKEIPVFVRASAEQQIAGHMREIDATVRAMVTAAVDAAEKARG